MPLIQKGMIYTKKPIIRDMPKYFLGNFCHLMVGGCVYHCQDEEQDRVYDFTT